MATIILGGQLQPATVRRTSGYRAASRDAHRDAHRSVSRVASRAASRAARTSELRLAPRAQALREAARTREIRRVYRRRRIGATSAVVAVAIAAVLSVFSVFGSSAAADGTAGRSVAPKYVVAQPGDTLWSIGSRIAPNAAITEVVDELVRLNGTSIETGQLVRIP